ncbi:hypothetical protein AWC02_00025 [Mycolicibacter engbaekii]|uniref:Uncharacterized protein n=1 Tax=Mycolicibacter engbaekii TaxID=188915 RepID=A0A1X1UDD0_9MYCO|nr:hypothetical protein AWC02_00025 [Mycolicibacter engbaekii]
MFQFNADVRKALNQGSVQLGSLFDSLMEHDDAGLCVLLKSTLRQKHRDSVPFARPIKQILPLCSQLDPSPRRFSLFVSTPRYRPRSTRIDAIGLEAVSGVVDSPTDRLVFAPFLGSEFDAMVV